MLSLPEGGVMSRYLQFVNYRTGERAENPGKIDVTGKSEREIERILSGMLRKAGDDWYVDDFETAAQTPPSSGTQSPPPDNTDV